MGLSQFNNLNIERSSLFPMFLRKMIHSMLLIFKAHRVIFRNRLWHYLLIPGFMSVVFVVISIAVISVYLPEWSDHITYTWMPDILQNRAASGIIMVMLWLTALLIIFMSCKHIILILFSPLLSRLSELTEHIVYHHPVSEWSTRQFLKDIIRSLRINIRIIILSLLFSFPAWLLVFIPVAGAIISAILLVLIQSYYSGFGFVDYTLERKLFSVGESVAWVKANRSCVIGVGLPYTGLMLIPIVGWFIAPAYATVAATLMGLEIIYPRQHPLEE